MFLKNDCVLELKRKKLQNFGKNHPLPHKRKAQGISLKGGICSMTAEKLSEALSFLDDDIIEEAEDSGSQKSNYKNYMAQVPVSRRLPQQ